MIVKIPDKQDAKELKKDLINSVSYKHNTSMRLVGIIDFKNEWKYR